MTALKPQILVVDEEQHQLDTLCRGLLLYGYECEGVLGEQAAISALNSRQGKPFDLILMDLSRPTLSSLTFIEKLQTRWSSIPLVVITGLVTTVFSRIVLKSNIAYLKKPFDPEMLHYTIRHVLRLVD